MNYPKRLIEVDLPIRRISAHARHEKSIRHGHISTLHIWWARRPLAACRAVICAALWPDPADALCPQAFREVADREMRTFAKAAAGTKEVAEVCGAKSWKRYMELAKSDRPMDLRTLPATSANGLRAPGPPTDLERLRGLLLDFIADFAAWEASTSKVFLETARHLTQAAHEALGGAPGTRPLVVDPFAGGGAIPLEALRVGADAFASDLNPVAVLLNKVVLEYIPKYGQRLADEVRKWGQWVKEEAEKELAEFYPKDPDGATPIAYLWARTIQCEGPGCGAEVPLIRSLWLARKKGRSIALRLLPRPRAKRVDFEIVENAKASDVGPGTVARGSATCPCCGFTTSVESVRRQLRLRQGGARDARLICVVTTHSQESGRNYRLAGSRDARFAASADGRVDADMIPSEGLPVTGLRRLSVPVYGITTFGNLYTSRQAMVLATLFGFVQKASAAQAAKARDPGLAEATGVVLSLVCDKLVDFFNSLTRWKPDAECPVQLFARQAVPMVWDFVEPAPFSGASGSWDSQLERTLYGLTSVRDVPHCGTAQQSSATHLPLPDDSVSACVTDPPYYDAIVYAHLADVFYVWLRRFLGPQFGHLFRSELCPKDEEIVVDPPHSMSPSTKDAAQYERMMTRAMEEARRTVCPQGIAVVVFAHKTTSGWEAILESLLRAGWCVTSSWPLDTEMANKVAALGQARLMSSIHLGCRPRENVNGTLVTDYVGDWREVLAELPKRIHQWLPRLVDEGIVGADAIFACLGPALEIFSRYSRVEKASGQEVKLRDYMEQVWAAVAKEALDTIFEGADTRGFEQDARLTAIWFWVMKEAANGNGNGRPKATAANSQEEETAEAEETDEADDNGQPAVTKKPQGYAMEFDAARKLAQGLGADLEELAKPGGILNIQGNVATLLAISRREEGLVGRQLSFFGSGVAGPVPRGRTRSARLKAVNSRKPVLFDPEPDVPNDPYRPYLPTLEPPRDERTLMERLLENGTTMLDRLHQAMILFGRGQTALLRPFLGQTAMGPSDRFWTLAQALSALYPTSSDEKRWVDGVLARKKGLGF